MKIHQRKTRNARNCICRQCLVLLSYFSLTKTSSFSIKFNYSIVCRHCPSLCFSAGRCWLYLDGTAAKRQNETSSLGATYLVFYYTITVFYPSVLSCNHKCCFKFPAAAPCALYIYTCIFCRSSFRLCICFTLFRFCIYL